MGLTSKSVSLFLGLILLCFSATGMAGVGSKKSEDHAETPSNGRPKADAAFSKESQERLAQWFFLPQEYFAKRFATKLVAGLMAAPEDEEKSASVLAELLGSLGNSQIEDLSKNVLPLFENLEKKSKDEKETLTDDEKLRLLVFQRILWASKILGANNESKPSEEFEKAFKKEDEKNQEKVKEFYAKLEDAKGSDKEKAKAARDWLFEKYDPQVLFTFLGSQSLAKNDALVADMTQALQKDGNLDLQKVSDNAAVRIQTGTDPKSHSHTIREFLKTKKDDLYSYKVSKEGHQKDPEDTFTPKTATEPKTQKPVPVEHDEKPNKTLTADACSKFKNLDEAQQAMSQIITDRCISCHLGPKAFGNKNGQIYFEAAAPNLPLKEKVSTILDALDGKNNRKQMPPTEQLTSEEKLAFACWIKMAESPKPAEPKKKETQTSPEKPEKPTGPNQAGVQETVAETPVAATHAESLGEWTEKKRDLVEVFDRQCGSCHDTTDGRYFRSDGLPRNFDHAWAMMNHESEAKRMPPMGSSHAVIKPEDAGKIKEWMTARSRIPASLTPSEAPREVNKPKLNDFQATKLIHESCTSCHSSSLLGWRDWLPEVNPLKYGHTPLFFANGEIDWASLKKYNVPIEKIILRIEDGSMPATNNWFTGYGLTNEQREQLVEWLRYQDSRTNN